MTKQQNKISSINSGALDHHDISTLMWHFFYFNELLSLHSDVFFPVIFNVSKLIDSLKHYTKNLLTVNQNDSMRLDKDRIFLPTNGVDTGSLTVITTHHISSIRNTLRYLLQQQHHSFCVDLKRLRWDRYVSHC